MNMDSKEHTIIAKSIQKINELRKQNGGLFPDVPPVLLCFGLATYLHPNEKQIVELRA